jgi:predicted NBD/HSP70 family sugar kinase
MQNSKVGRHYGGLLVTSREVWIASGQAKGLKQNYESLVQALKPGNLDEVQSHFPYEGEAPKKVLERAVQTICEAEPDLCAIGVAAYGPLMSVDPAKRDDKRYGRISASSVHQRIQGLDIFGVVSKAAQKATDRQLEVIVHTDVTAGALAEVVRRCGRTVLPKADQMRRDEVLIFLHVADGIGGAIVSGGQAMSGALHPEVGYIAAQLDPRDVWGQRKMAAEEAVDHMVVIEDLASETALRLRAGLASADFDQGKWIAHVPRPIWDIESFYLAQMCASLTMMVAPHKIVLHSEFIGAELLANIRRDFDRLVTRRGTRYLRYETMEDSEQFIRRPLAPGPMRFGSLCLAVQADLLAKG